MLLMEKSRTRKTSFLRGRQENEQFVHLLEVVDEILRIYNILKASRLKYVPHKFH